MRIRPVAIELVAISVMLFGPTCPATATITGGRSTAREVNARILEYLDAYPDDLVGQDKLVLALTGRHVTVAIAGVDGQFDVATAERIIERRKALRDASGIPAFTLSVRNVPLVGPPNQSRVVGHWDFPDSWAGQAPPVDLAALTFQMPSCMHMVGYAMTTATYSGTQTYRGSLRSTSGFTGGLWNVSDYTKGFVTQADNGAAAITVQNWCNRRITVGAAFDYEANQGGSVLGVSVSLFSFSVSYSSPGLVRHQGTPPIYFTL